VQKQAKDDQSIPKKNKVVRFVDALKKYVDWSNLKDRNGITYLAEGSRLRDANPVKWGGRVQSDEPMNTDKPFSGYAKRFYENGQEEISARFKDGYPVFVDQWQEDGTRKWKLGFMVGKVVGSDLPFEDWSDSNSSHYTFCVVWYENGQQKLDRRYKDGKLNGPSIMWNEKGKQTRYEEYKDGKLDGHRGWHYIKGSEVPFLRAFYEDGKLMRAGIRKPNGKWCAVTNVKNGNGVLVWYKEDGTENYREVYKDGIKVED